MIKKISVTDVKVSDILVNMAEEFGVKCTVENNQHCLKIPEEYGSGEIKAIEFESGLGVIDTDFLLKKPFHFKLEKGVIHPVKFIFNRASKFTHRFLGQNELHEINKLDNVIVSSNHKETHEFILPADTPVCIFSIEINRKIFEHKIEDFIEEMNEDLIELFRDVNGIVEFYHKSQYSLDISKLIKEFTETDLEGFMKSVYLEGKAQQILVLQLQQYLDDLNEPGKRKILRKATINSIHEAIDIIKTEIDSISSIEKLANQVGLSAKSLQAGFQVLHNSSVNDYIKNYRIEKAKDLIENTALNITEITYHVGINSRSYFSKLFKEKYGITPKQYYSKVRQKTERAKKNDESQSA